MKNHIKNLVIALAVLFFASCESNDNPVNENNTPPVNVPTNKVLVELFTNTSCIPCVEANQFLDGINNLEGITDNDTNVIIIRYHTTLFAGDPFYLYNTTDNNARMSYYPNSAIVNPFTFLLGVFMGNYSSSPWINKLNEKLGESRSFGVTLSNQYNSSSRNGTVAIGINQFSGNSISDLVYHAVLIEDGIPYNAPNGETHFNNTLRDLITPTDGQSFTINSGQTSNFNLNYGVATEINQNNAFIIVFVQRVSTKEVFGVNRIKIIN